MRDSHKNILATTVGVVGASLLLWKVKNYFQGKRSGASLSTKGRKGAMAFELRGQGQVVYDADTGNYSAETTGNTVARGVVRVNASQEWLGFQMKGDARVWVNTKTGAALAKCLTNDSTVGLISGDKNEVMRLTNAGGGGKRLEDRAKLPAIEDKAAYPRPHICEFYELCCPRLQQQTEGIAALVPKQNLEKIGNTYRIRQHVPAFDRSCGIEQNQPFFNQKILANGTAFLGTKNRIITAGHCLEEDVKNLYVVFNFKFTSAQHENIVFEQKDVYTIKKVIHRVTEQGREDWAVAELDRPANGKFIPTRSHKTPVAKTPLYITGHPLGLPMKTDLVARVNRPVPHDNSSSIFYTDLNAFHGNSGSPVFNFETCKVEGILVNGKSDFQEAQNGQRVFAEYPSHAAIEGCTTIQRVEAALTR